MQRKNPYEISQQLSQNKDKPEIAIDLALSLLNLTTETTQAATEHKLTPAQSDALYNTAAKYLFEIYAQQIDCHSKKAFDGLLQAAKQTKKSTQQISSTFFSQDKKSEPPIQSDELDIRPNNTVLHDVILKSDSATALIEIKKDISADIINVRSLENTPLILALKTGNIVIAEALLSHPKINVHLQDCRGLTALHWACMLRQDKIIKMLLEGGADPHLKTPQWAYPASGGDRYNEFTPLALYKRDILLINFVRYHDADEEANLFRNHFSGFQQQWPFYFSTFFEKNPRFPQQLYHYLPGFVDRPDLHIPGEMPYTDIVFHMESLCTNLKWHHPDTKFLGTKEVNQSAHRFKINFFRGIFDFSESRNAIPVNPELIQKMESMQISAISPRLSVV